MEYSVLIAQLKALTENVPHRIANLANASALLWQHMENINWAGFYLLEGDTLILGPFQGKPACIEIPIGKGVCGTAVSLGDTVLVKNVHEFPGHIACDCASNSEIVVPLKKDGRIVGVLDIDSPVIGRFADDDRDGLEKFASQLSAAI